MPTSLRKALVAVATSLAFAVVSGALAGCAPQGTTPTCNDNVTADGIQNDVENPCNAFPKCVIGGNVRPAAECCVDPDGEPFTGSRLTSCLYGFGEIKLSGAGGSDGGGGGAGGAGGGG